MKKIVLAALVGVMFCSAASAAEKRNYYHVSAVLTTDKGNIGYADTTVSVITLNIKELRKSLTKSFNADKPVTIIAISPISKRTFELDQEVAQ